MTQKKEGRREKGLFAATGALLLAAALSPGLSVMAASSSTVEPEPAQSKPADYTPAQSKAAESKATESKAADSKAAESKAAESKADETKPAESKPSGSIPADARPTGSVHYDATPDEAKPTGSKLGDGAVAPVAVQHTVAFLTVVLAQDEKETFDAISRDKMDGFVKDVTAAADNFLTGKDKFDTKQLIVRCSLKPDGKHTYALTSKPGLSGPLTAGLDQVLQAVAAPTVTNTVNMEIIFAVADRQTQIAAQARHLIRGGKTEEAVTLLAPLATDDCKNAFVWQQLGWAYSAKGDFPNAERTLKRAIQLDPRDFDTWANLVSTYHSQGRIKEAEEAAKKNLDCATNEESTDIVNINTALYGGDWAGAETILRKLCKRTGDYGVAYQVILAYALRWQGKNDEAKKLLESALNQPPQMKQQLDDYYAKLAEKQLALLKGDWKTAEELGRLDLSKDPKDYESLYDMGLALKGEGKLDEARKAFEKAVQPVTPESVLKAVHVQMKELSAATAGDTSGKTTGDTSAAATDSTAATK